MTTLDDRVRQDERPADLLAMAAELVIASQHGSSAMVQRKLRTTWDDTATLMVRLEVLRVVGPPDSDGTRPVLVAPDGLDETLATIATLDHLDDPEPATVQVVDVLDDDQEEDVNLADQDEPVSLVKPGAQVAIRPAGELAWPGHDLDIRPTLVVRTLQVVARVAVQPAVTRPVAVGLQLPRVTVRLAGYAPRGAGRLAGRYRAWLNDVQAVVLIAKHAEAGEGDQHTKVSEARAARVSSRRRVSAAIVALLAVIGLAWWAPTVFAGVLAVLVFVGVVALARSVCNNPKELAICVAVASGAAGLAWWKGPDLAALVPGVHLPWWAWILLGGVAVIGLGWLGRTEDKPLVVMPAHMASAEPPPITAPMIVEALFRVGVPSMTTTAADKGMRDEIRVRAPGVAKAQQGYLIELELPPGITAGDVAKQREELAGALRRPLGCVWPSGGGDHPGHLRIYMGNKPMATAPQIVWPLAAGNPIDLFEPFPLFTDEEGNWVSVTLLGTHAVVAGASGFGKSVTLRQLAAAVGLDPRSQPYVFDGKISGDLSPMQKIAHAYYEGAEPEDIAETLAALQGIEKEMRRRARFLRTLPPEERSPKVTSALASKYPHLSPIVLLIDEVQEYTEYGVKDSKEDKKIREAFTATLTRISRLGRSAGIAMVLVSQKPEASVISTAIMGNCTIRICHKVTEQNHNDQVLGTSAYKNGYNAALFSQEDKGLAWLRAEGDPRVVRSWSAMVELEPAVELVDKAYALRKARGLLTGQAADDGAVDAEVVISITEDVMQVMRQHQTPTAHLEELVAWLEDLRPVNYGSLDVHEVGKRVRNAGMKVSPVWRGDRTKQGIDLRKQPEPEQ